VCQEVFIVVHRKLPEFEGRSTVQTWIYGICLRTASDYRRRAYFRRESAVADVPEKVVQPMQEEGLAQKQASERLAQLLDQLDEAKRQVFVLYEIEELEMKQVADIVGCPLQTAYSRLRAARKLLADAIENESEGTR
jgi:RNA polymerase sigma-70 factor (ECF subfamily)